jgi:energy-coupling factor transporter transmembrane protein EcfT
VLATPKLAGVPLIRFYNETLSRFDMHKDNMCAFRPPKVNGIIIIIIIIIIIVVVVVVNIIIIIVIVVVVVVVRFDMHKDNMCAFRPPKVLTVFLLLVFAVSSPNPAWLLVLLPSSIASSSG